MAQTSARSFIIKQALLKNQPIEQYEDKHAAVVRALDIID